MQTLVICLATDCQDVSMAALDVMPAGRACFHVASLCMRGAAAFPDMASANAGLQMPIIRAAIADVMFSLPVIKHVLAWGGCYTASMPANAFVCRASICCLWYQAA